MSAFGADRLVEELKGIGYTVVTTTGGDKNTYVVFPEFDILLGKFEGRTIGLGLQAAVDYPNSVHAAIHVKADPQLYEPAQNIPNVRNVQASQLGPEWRYWSQNFNWAAETQKNVRRLMAKINAIFKNA